MADRMPSDYSRREGRAARPASQTPRRRTDASSGASPYRGTASRGDRSGYNSYDRTSASSRYDRSGSYDRSSSYDRGSSSSRYDRAGSSGRDGREQREPHSRTQRTQGARSSKAARYASHPTYSAQYLDGFDRGPRLPIARIVIIVAILLLVVLLAFGLSKCIGSSNADGGGQAATTDQDAQDISGTQEQVDTSTWPESNDTSVSSTVIGHGVVTDSGVGKVTFSAVGDNVINQQLIDYADEQSGESGDDSYDFSPLYKNVDGVIAGYDISFINQETVMGGTSFLGFQGYPSFNSPDELAGNLVDCGWDVFNCNSNHTYDIGSDAIYYEMNLWKNFPDVLTVGMYETEEDAQTIHMIERNGIKIAFLSYGYGENGYENSELEDGSLVNFYSDDKLERDIPNAVKCADVVIVYLHAGEEYTHEINDDQAYYAQLAADLGADMVLCSHSHYIQPITWLTGENGNKTLCAYGLGDFASGYTWIECILGGMLSCDFVMGDDSEVTIENVVWTPTIEHMQDGDYTIYFLKDYTEDLASVNELFSPDNDGNSEEALADPYSYVKQVTSDVIGDEVTIDM